MSETHVCVSVDLTYACNYECPYCVLPPVEKHRPVADWVRAFERLRSKYGDGRVSVNLSGGEPSIYPGFFELVKSLAQSQFVSICTNLSWDVGRLIPEVSRERMWLSPTLHPTQVPFEEFFAKLLYVRDYVARPDGGRPQVNCVAWPSQMGSLPRYKEDLEREGFALFPRPLMVGGDLANDEREMEMIESVSPGETESERHQAEFRQKKFSPKGRLCRAGQVFATVRADGMTKRCSRYEEAQLGNFFSGDFSLWPEPKVCSQDWCPLEHFYLVPEVEKAPLGGERNL